MAYPTLIIGGSGTGKSSSIEDLPVDKTGIINCNLKPEPFKPKGFKILNTDDYQKVISTLKTCKADIIVLDDCGYLMTNQFMRGHSSAGSGNGVFTLYNQIGDNFFTLIDVARRLPDNKRVYFIMHEETDEFGKTRPKSIGKMISEKLCIEGCFTVVLRSMRVDGKYIFRTQTDGYDVAKSPIGMFDSEEIPNDLALVDKRICEYYGIGENANETAE